ncbi:MAG: lytic transglycosylase domain-containing protein [bacterium]
MKPVVIVLSLLLLTSAVSPADQTLHLNALSSEDQLCLFIASRARHYEFDLSIIHKMIDIESMWNAETTSSEGAVGLMQVMLSTAKDVLGKKCLTGETLKDPFLNVECGIKYLAQLRKYFKGNLMLALTSYNRGIGNVRTDLKLGKDPVNNYARKIMKGSNK